MIMDLQLFFILLQSFASIADVPSAKTWIEGLRKEETISRQELNKIRIETFSTIDKNKKKYLSSRIVKVQKDLDRLNEIISKASDQSFKENNRTDWADVVQQARALQAWNEDAVIDLEGVLRHAPTLQNTKVRVNSKGSAQEQTE